MDVTDVVDQLGLNAKPPSSYGGFSRALGDTEAAKEKETAPLVKEQKDTYEKDRATSDAAFQKLSASTPDLTPAPKPPINDPWQAWTSPAMLFGLLAAGFTKAPATAAMKAATAAINGKRQGDIVAYQQAMDDWKANNDLAFKRHEMMQADYRAAAEKMKDDLEAGHNLYLATAAKYDDHVGVLKAQAGLLHDMDQINLERSRLAESMKARQDALSMHHEEMVEREKDRRAQLGLANADWSPDFMDFAAKEYVETGKPPPFGMGSPSARRQFSNAVASYIKSKDITAADALAEQAQNKAQGQELSTLARTRANVANFSATFDKELDLAIQLAGKGAAGQSPVINRWIQAGRKSIEGDPDVAAFDAAVTSAKNEYARIMSAPGATGGVTSDAARKEADEIFDRDMSPEQLVAVAQTMRQGTQNRMKSIDDEFDATRTKIGHGLDAPRPAPATAAPTSPSPAPAAKPPGREGQVKYDAHGNKVTFKGGQWVDENGVPQ